MGSVLPVIRPEDQSAGILGQAPLRKDRVVKTEATMPTQAEIARQLLQLPSLSPDNRDPVDPFAGILADFMEDVKDGVRRKLRAVARGELVFVGNRLIPTKRKAS